MKYSIIINQAGVIDAGLGEKTDLIDWAIIDYIIGWQAVPNAARINNHVWINLKHIAKEMPMLGVTTKSALSKRITKIEELGLISKERDDFGRLYVAITSLCHGIVSFRAATSPVFETGSNGSPDTKNKDQETGRCPEKQQVLTGGTTGVLPTEQHSVVNPLSVNQLSVNQDKPPTKVGWIPPSGLNLEAWSEYEEHRKTTKGPFSDLARTKAANSIINLSHDEQQSTIDRSIQAGWAGLFPDKTKQSATHDLSNQIYTGGSI